MKKYKHILAAVDLGEGSEKVIAHAKEMAALFQAKLSVMHVVEPLPGYGYAFIAPNDIETELFDEAKKQLHKMAVDQGVESGNIYVDMGPAKTQLLEKAGEIKADLIVVGTHKHMLLGVLGSTANAIIHNATSDVLTFRLDQPHE